MPTQPATLPIYRLDSIGGDAEKRAEKLAIELFGFRNFSTDTPFDTAIVREGHRRVEWEPAPGLLWMADWARLWQSSGRPTLPDNAWASHAAAKFFHHHRLLPKGRGVSIGPPMVTGTRMAHYVGTGTNGSQTRTHRLDVHVAFPVSLRNGDKDHPLIGRGLKWSITFGDRGEIIGCIAGTLGAIRAQGSSPAVPLSEKTGPQTPVLAYEYISSGPGKSALVPVWIVRATESLSSPFLRFAATEISREYLSFLEPQPQPQQPQPQPPARPTNRPMSRRQTPRQMRHAARTAGGSALPFVGVWSPNPHRSFRHEGELLNAELTKTGWRNVGYSDDAAREFQWNRRRTDFVEQVDLAYFSGNASSDGWVLEKHVAPDVQYGQAFLNWVAISGCGPIQDEIITPNNGHAFERWEPMFNGLRGLLGFATTCMPRSETGETFVRRMREGHSVVHAWLRAARECHPLDLGTGPSGARDNFATWAGAIVPKPAPRHNAFEEELPGAPHTRRTKPKALTAIWTPV